MFSFPHKLGKYVRVHTSDNSLDLDIESDTEKVSVPTGKRKNWFTTTYLFVIIILFTGALAYLQIHDTVTSQASESCQSPSLRKEWRTLSIEEQYDYIRAAQCLRKIPSRLHDGLTIYDDFPFLHDVVGDYAHETAAFLTWHRYFIHLYETILKDDCGYLGSLPYWDWSLDWKDLSLSPVFQNSPGFGGDSDPGSFPSGEAIVGGDRCINDGPWAGLEVHWWTQIGQPHCLSRGFEDVRSIHDMGQYLDGQSIEQLLRQPDYKSFFMEMFHGIHNVIQVAIGGDIMFNTAPYDPLFYLHHSQLDRLWWRWQQMKPSHQMQYLGPSNNHSDVLASLDDFIPMGDFAPAIAAKELMNTESGILCYRY